jgi:hypothetical protein|tara:strand:+ start:265 stop:1047 length:783 start_codon:yes stop_codon:yes gene_type:complete
MKNFFIIGTLAVLTSGCMATSASTIKYRVDENTRPQDYSYITDPTGTFDHKVHRFQITDKCGNVQRGTQTGIIGNQLKSDCAQNSVRSEIYEEVWEDNRPGETQPQHRWYSWNVYLPNDYPIQDSGRLLLGQFHNSECPHLLITSTGDDNGKLYLETSELYNGDCRETGRSQISNIKDLRGKWTNFTLEVKWKNNDTGLANIWLDNQKVLAYNGRTLTKQKENRNFLKVGIYQCCNDGVIKPGNAMFTTPKSGATRESVQ